MPTEGVSDAPTVCVFGTSWLAFERFAGLLAALRERHERIGFILMADDAGIRDRLKQRFPFAAVLAPPAGLRRYAPSFAKRLRIKCLLALDGIEPVDRAFVAVLRRRCVPVVALGVTLGVTLGGGGAIAGREHHRKVDRFVVGEAAVGRRLHAAGVEAERIEVVEGLGEQGRIGPQAVRRVVEILNPLLAQHGSLVRRRRQRAGSTRPAAFIARAMEGALVRLHASRLRRLETLEELRCALGAPRTILCLGNGPSSEDAGLRELPHDSLFRVNHRWLERGFLVEPDMVFTGSKKTVSALEGAAVRGVVFGLSSIEIETMLLPRWLLLRPHRRLTWFTPERAGVLTVDPASTVRPTNGVIMLATAVALQPERLVVGGIDLFQDPEGAYPGDPATPNAYAAAHERSTELAWILRILERYRGELVIVGDVLQRHWAAAARSLSTAALPEAHSLPEVH